MTAPEWIKLIGTIVGGMFTVILGLLAAIWTQNRKQLEAIEGRQVLCKSNSTEEHRRLHDRIDVVEENVTSHAVAIARIEGRQSLAGGAAE
jgi:cytoskeletal protein RodZ